MKRLLFLSIASLFLNQIFAQVAITDQGGNPLPDNSAILDLQSTDRGLLPPRMTTNQRDSIQSPAEGLVIFNSQTGCIQIFLALQGWSDIYCDCVNPPSAAFSSPGSITQYSSASFSANTPGVTYNWSFQGGSPPSTNTQNPSVTWNTPGSYNVSLIVTDALGCTDTQSTTVTVDPCTPPSSAFTNPGAGAVNNAVSFSANTAGQNYAWSFQSGSPASSTAQSPSVTWTAAGTYNIQLIVSDANGCADTTLDTIRIVNCVFGGSQTFNYSGSIVSWTIPAGVCTITIDASGARGGNGSQGNGGLGARIQGDFNVTPGTVLNILVGQQGQDRSQYVGGGGGGSFVWENSTNTLLVAAGGGGGGGGGSGGTSSCFQGGDGLTTQNGGAAVCLGDGGGSGGAGGTFWSGSPSWHGAGGTGWNSNGANGQASNCSNAGGGQTPLNGGAGGNPGGNSGYVGAGGFGGGGGAQGGCNAAGGGGGGGYSGGAGGGRSGNFYGGGGGGSFNGGTNQSNTGGVRNGNGQVIISW